MEKVVTEKVDEDIVRKGKVKMYFIVRLRAKNIVS